MFTLEQIEEIHRKLQLFGVKDKDLPILTEQLNGNEIITVVKDGRNIQLLISQLLDFNSFTPEQLESLKGPKGDDGKNAYQTWLSQGNVGTYDDYIAVLQLPALLAAETSTIRVNNKLNEADGVIEELNSLADQTQDTLSEINIAKDLAYETVTHPPVIIDKYWHSWNHETDQYDTTYIKAEGDSAYLLWLEAGNVGTVEDYLADIKGEKGDPFRYDDFTSEQIEDLKRPAIEAAESVQIIENQISINEQSRVQAENERETAETTRVSNENNRVTAEQERVEAESLRATAESSRELAESLRVEAELLRQSNTQEAISNAENATENANTAATNADNARLSIQDDLALKANQTDLVQLADDVEQLAYVKIKNEAVNGNFENGLIEPFRRVDASTSSSTLAINSSTPISGNYDIRLTIITPELTSGRPIFYGLNRAGNIGDKIYLQFYAKILSGTPIIHSIGVGISGSVSQAYGGNVINGRNTRIIDAEGTDENLGLIYFKSPSVWDMQMDNFMRINLTETFGAGNEPTKEEMDLLISTLGIDYFEGEITIPAQKVMQWQLKLIRKNKNAIIALGGTII